MKKFNSAQDLLNYLNAEYLKAHIVFEDNFWKAAMGDHAAAAKKNIADKKRNDFRTNSFLKAEIDTWVTKTTGKNHERLSYWQDFFSRFQAPKELEALRFQIGELETKIRTKRATRKEGYIDPYSKKFIPASRNAMSSLIGTNNDEKIRKACFEATEKLAEENAGDYVELVKLRNEYTQKLGYKDYCDFRLYTEERMTKSELYSLFDYVYEKTKYGFENLKNLEKEKPGLRKPWNFSYMLASSFVKEADPYFQFENAVQWWIESYVRLGISFQKDTLVLDLLDRKGKDDNGFCHWPIPVHFEGNTRRPGTAQFTCTVALGIPGQAFQGLNTLFHEGGHAAHFLNCSNEDICLNTEYPPMSAAWAETQSMFLDEISTSIEWRTQYAKNNDGELYPFDLFVRQNKALHSLRPLGMMSILMVSNFEKEIYETKNLTKEKVIQLAKRNYRKYTDRSVDSLMLLDVPHIYSWESTSYHGYGLAELALSQWRDYFFKKYGYIVDNPNIGKEMQKVWKPGSKYPFPEMVKMATGKKLSPQAYLKNVTMSLPMVLKKGKEKIARQVTVRQKPIKGNELEAIVRLIHGKQVIADSSKGLEQMCKKYATWLKTQYSSKIG